ncbi:hypothetical protein GCM10009734_97080 [Nonomuraea bangladeshensis]
MESHELLLWRRGLEGFVAGAPELLGLRAPGRAYPAAVRHPSKRVICEAEGLQQDSPG